MTSVSSVDTRQEPGATTSAAGPAVESLRKARVTRKFAASSALSPAAGTGAEASGADGADSGVAASR